MSRTNMFSLSVDLAATRTLRRIATGILTAGFLAALSGTAVAGGNLEQGTTAGDAASSDGWTIADADGNIIDHVDLDTADSYRRETHGTTNYLPSTSQDLSKLSTLDSPEPNNSSSNSGIPIDLNGIIGGEDLRYPVSPTIDPYSAITQIKAELGDCTGFLIGSDDLVTAGHCLIEGGSGNYRPNITANFQATPDGKEYSCGLSYYAVPDAFALDGDPDYDYAWVGLDCEAGYVFGTFGLLDGADPGSQRWALAGYPATGKYWPIGQQVAMVDVVEQYSPWRLAYFIDTEPGQSGSPIFNNATSCGHCATGIHAYGYGQSSPVSDKNSGTYITPDLYSYLTYFRDWQPA